MDSTGNSSAKEDSRSGLKSKAKEYSAQKKKLELVNLALTPALLVFILLTPLTHLFKAWSSEIVANPYGVLAFYFLFLSLFHFLIDFPLSYYSGFILEHRYGLSNHSLASWMGDMAKRALLSFGFSLLLILALYGLIWHWPHQWWIWAWAGYAFVSFVMGKIFPVLIVPLFYKYSPVADEGLKDRIFALAKKYGMPLKNIYSLNLSRTTKKANAAFMGMGKTKRVVLSDTLIENFTGDEIEVVVAHELGHFKHRDIWKILSFGLIVSLAGFYLLFRTLTPLAYRLGLEGPGDIAALPLIFLIFVLFFLALAPLQNGFSRWMERLADLFALEAYPNREAFISCMEKLGTVNLADPDPHPLYEWFFYDHPSIPKRVAMARQWKKAVLLIVVSFLALSPAQAAESDTSEEVVEKRAKTELLSYFLKDPKQAAIPMTVLSIQSTNEGASYFQKQQYDLARKSFEEAIRQDAKNAIAYELLGDIDYMEQKLGAAKSNWEIAYSLQPRESLTQKIEKVRKEAPVEKKLSTYREQHFIIKYHNENVKMEGFELRELLLKTYNTISKDFAYYFNHQVIVLLYDEAEFRKISNAPHWAAGLYDGKVRMPVSTKGFKKMELEALTTHEVTHAFVGAMSLNQAPAWINEGLAEYEENKVKKNDLAIFKAALRIKSLIPVAQMMSEASSAGIRDTNTVHLFYQQSFQIVSYMIDRYRMFRVKELLQEFGKGKNSDEALRAVLHISPERLEKEWLATLSK
ncbi:MAG: M48 family metalloprotease [Candidatus Omnitrophica bacterium]|nr:M48 family metalloprotease [Candidatus Omnitrophota bacterium]